MTDPMQWLHNRLPYFAHGGDYNPEQWMSASDPQDEAIWREDMRLMRLAGVNVATVGVFSWVSLQPDEHTFTFGWLDRVMDRLAENGIFACLATGTAAQPAWLSKAYSDVLPVDELGIRKEHGQRQRYCPTSPDFRRLSQDLARRLAERYRAHPALLLWHVSNEYGPSCRCDRCADRFRTWLQGRYDSLEDLNRRWVTAFWSHTYTAWEQIVPPGPRSERSIQGLLLDYNRFMSDMNLECYLGEAQVLRLVTPQVPVTTNFMQWYKPLDYFSWAPHLDVISWDSYPDRSDHPSSIALRHDLMRGLKGGQSWLLMEQTPSQVQWRAQDPLKRPGVMRMLNYQAIARGSDAVMYFQWRQSAGSAEKYHGAVVSHAGHEHTRVFGEVAALGAELRSLGGGLLGTRLPARVALVFSWPNWWNVENEYSPSKALKYVEEVERYYRPLWEGNVAVDVVPPGRELSGYDLVIAPVLNMVTGAQGEAIERYVENGGVFVTTFFSGVVDENDRVWLGGYPGPLRRTLGIWVEEYDPLTPDMTNRVQVAPDSWLPGGSYECDLWCEVVHLEGAVALATYEADFYAGRPAISEHRFGKGRAIYVATRTEQTLINSLVGGLLADLGVTSPLEAPAGVEVTRREGDGRSYTFVLNHNSTPVEVPLPAPMQDMISGQSPERTLTLPPLGVAILTAGLDGD
ncbi:MAG TPA: beta-galactosidase [Chloroflexia bacterium]|nr:beta-galactosidase [Chloroflexia bacterium]